MHACCTGSLNAHFTTCRNALTDQEVHPLARLAGVPCGRQAVAERHARPPQAVPPRGCGSACACACADRWEGQCVQREGLALGGGQAQRGEGVLVHAALRVVGMNHEGQGAGVGGFPAVHFVHFSYLCTVCTCATCAFCACPDTLARQSTVSGRC